MESRSGRRWLQKLVKCAIIVVESKGGKKMSKGLKKLAIRGVVASAVAGVVAVGAWAGWIELQRRGYVNDWKVKKARW